MHLQQHSKGRNKFCAGPAQPLAGKRTFPIQFIQGSRNQRQKRHGCVLPHRAEPVNLIQVIGRQHVQGAAHQGRLVMPENLPQAEKGNASRQQLDCQQIGMVRPLHTHPPSSAIPPGSTAAVRHKTTTVHSRSHPLPCCKRAPGTAPPAGRWAMPSIRERWNDQSAPLQCAAVGHGRGAGQHGHCTQYPQAGTQFSICQPQRAAGYGQQQKGIQQHKQQQPARHTGPRIQHILFDMHSAPA